MTDASARIQEMMRRFEEQARKAQELQSAVQEVRGSASSPDGSVTVTVAPSGAVLDLQLTPNAVRRSHTDLQQTILAALRQAQADAAQQLNDTAAPLLGDQLEQLRDAFPAPPSGANSAPRRSGPGFDDDDDFSEEPFLR